ncbi:histidine protein kinase 1 [[Candida] railenensis]|uniref:histidine kinase n=1 Tax=[Candida] railenensis TaxID=45579 RepID=A0A9P0QNK1_9ASCO|nr:histidine protein kinase 1 [[Candida] railenensis]
MLNESENNSETSSISDESLMGGTLGYQSFISNINYVANHVDSIMDVDVLTAAGQPLSASISREPKIEEYLQSIEVDRTSSYLQEQVEEQQAKSQLHDQSITPSDGNQYERPKLSVLNGYMLKTKISQDLKTDLFYHAIDIRTEEKKEVVLRISLPYSNTTNILGIFNEWHILSGPNSSRRHPLWGNNTLSNEFIRGEDFSATFDYTRDDIVNQVTLPQGIDGILYPIHAFCLPYFKNGKHKSSMNRLVLVYENNDYARVGTYYRNYVSEHKEELETYRIPHFQAGKMHKLSTRPRTGTFNSIGSNNLAMNLAAMDLHTQTHDLNFREEYPDNTVASTATTVLSTNFSLPSKNNTPITPSSANGIFEDLQLKVRQFPKHIITVVEIVDDIIHVLKTLRIVHELGVIHNGLTSTNILKSTKGLLKDKIVLTGWDFNCSIQPEDCSYGYRKSHLRQVPQLLPYLSPESTGEANISVDYRSDFYSLGIIMYELIVGCLPFQSEKPANLIRMHILQKPIAPHLLAGGWVSEQLSDIILRLLEKRPEDRFTDCVSIINNLAQVKNSYIDYIFNCSSILFDYWSKHDHFSRYLIKEEIFAPNEYPGNGSPTMFLIPKKVLGRKEEYINLNKVYESAGNGVNMILITGEDGVGKSTMMQDLRLAPLSNSEFYFNWKFNDYDSNTSVYQCLIHGIRSIFQQILATSSTAITRWRDMILSKINSDLSVLFTTVPELKQILGVKYSSIYENEKNRTSNTCATTPLSQNSDFNDYFGGHHEDITSSEYSLIIGSNDQTLNLEIKFKHIIKVLYSLFALDGYTVFLEDMQWCSNKEWSMIAETLEYFTASNIQDDISVKLVATFGVTDILASETSPKIDRSQLLEYISSTNISLHCIDLKNLQKGYYKKFIESTLKVNSHQNSIRVRTDMSLNTSSSSDNSSVVEGFSPIKESNSGKSINSSSTSSTLLSSYSSFHPPTLNTPTSKDSKIETLTDLLFTKTEGSILYTIMFFRTAYLKGLIQFDKCDARREQRWDITYEPELFGISKKNMIKYYLDVALSKEARSLMKFAVIAAKGNHFYLSDLSVVSDLAIKEAVQLLNLCLQTKVIVSGNTIYKFPFYLSGSDRASVQNRRSISDDELFGLSDSEIWQIATQTRYRFVHDSISRELHQEMIELGEIEQYHKKCGMRSYKKYVKDNKLSISQYLIMANHFVLSSETPATPEEASMYFEVLVQAGIYASSTQKMELSLLLFETADKFIDSKDHKRKLKNLLTICQVHFYLKNYETCLDIIANSEKEHKGIDTTMFVLPRIRCLFSLERYQEGIDAAIAGLSFVKEVEVSSDPIKNSKIAEKLSNKIPLSVLEIRKLVQKERTTNSRILLIYELISEIIIPTYIINEDSLRHSLASQAILLMHEYGVSPYCALPLLEYANSFIRNYDESSYLKVLEFSRLSLSLVDSDNRVSFSYIQRVYEVYITGVATLMEPVSEVLKYYDIYISDTRPFVKAISNSYDSQKVASKMHLLYLTGHSVSDIVAYGVKNISSSGNYMRQDVNFVQLQGFRLLHEDITYEEFTSQFDIVEGCPRDFSYCYYMVCLFWFIMNSKYEDAGEILYSKIGDMIDDVPFMLMHLQYFFYAAMVLRVRPSTVPEYYRQSMLDKINNFFNVWNSNCPTNFRTKYLLVQAMAKSEDTSISVLDILDIYEEAIEWSERFDMWHDVAWANLLCGTWLINQYNMKRARPFVNRAYTLFQKSRDHAIVTRIKRKYSSYIEEFNWAGFHTNQKRNLLVNTVISPRVSAKGNIISSGSNFPTTHGSMNEVIQSNSVIVNSQLRKGENLNEMYSQPIVGPKSRHKSARDRNNTQNNVGLYGPIKVHTPIESSFEVKALIPDTSDNKLQDDPSELNKAVNACLSISESLNDFEIVQKLLESTIRFSTADYGAVTLNINDEPFILAIGTASSIFKINNEPLSSRTDLCPLTLVKHVLQSGEIISKEQDYAQFITKYGKDDYYHENPVFSVVCFPLRSISGTFGALYLEIQDERQSLDTITTPITSAFVDGNKRDLLNLLCSQAAVSLEKARLYTQMEYAKKTAEDATAEKASFLANMSHEIRTPFNSLLSCSIFLLDTELTLTQREYVETIKSSAMVTLNIIDGILAFSKIEHGSFTLENAKFSLNECIESALQLVSEQAATNHLELVYFNRCSDIDFVFGDVTRFRQIVINLVGNSVKFTKEGYILVETTAVEITKDRYEIIVSVTDTGIGIPKESHNKVFGAFSQVDGSSQRIYGGSGLGLAISKKLADIMGGSLTFESSEGSGSTFKFIVNAQVEASNTKEIEISKDDTKNLDFEPKSLIIDFNKLGSIALKNCLEYFGLNVSIIEEPMSITSQEYLIIFILADQFDEFKKLNDLSTLNSKIVIVAQYGKTLPEELHTNFVNSMLLIPFKRSKVTSILKDVKSKLQIGTKTLNVRLDDGNGRIGLKKRISSTILLAEKYPLKILLAEDNIINIKVALQHLKKLGYVADHAKDGVEVLEMCHELAKSNEKYDIILLDIQMPRKDGFTAAIELQEQFKSNGKDELLPAIVALTANVAGEDREKSLRCGMVDFIAKPILPSELKRVLTRVGEREFVKEDLH